MSQIDPPPTGAHLPPPPPPPMPSPSAARPSAPPAAAPEKASWPAWKSTLIALFGGLALIFAGVFALSLAFDTSFTRPNLQTALFLGGALLGFVGVGGVLVGSVMLLVKLLRMLFAAAASQPSASSRTSPPTSR